jgi:hypothetical protein
MSNLAGKVLDFWILTDALDPHPLPVSIESWGLDEQVNDLQTFPVMDPYNHLISLHIN